MKDRQKWDTRFMDIARTVATWSKDPTRRVGAVVVAPDMRALSVGYNGFPRGVEDHPERLADSAARLTLSVHAEKNAMMQATFPLTGATLYITYFPCHECMKEVIQRGVARIVAPPQPKTDSKWQTSWDWAVTIAKEAGVEITEEIL